MGRLFWSTLYNNLDKYLTAKKNTPVNGNTDILTYHNMLRIIFLILASNISRVISFWKIHYHILLFRHCINVVPFQTNHDTRCKSGHKFPA